MLPTERLLDTAHARARDARARYAPAEERALGTIAAAAALAILWIILPIGLGVLMGTLLAFTIYPWYKRWAHRTAVRPALVSLGATSIATAAVAAAIGSLVYVIVRQGLAVLGTLPQSFAPGGSAARLVERLRVPLSALGLQPTEIADRLQGAIGGIATSLAGWAAQIVGFAFDALLALVFMATTMFVVLIRWNALAKRAEHLIPINPHHTRRLLRELRRLGRHTVIGNFGTALVQGTIAAIGYAIAGLPAPAFLGVITAVASLVPVLGTPLLWLPAGLGLIAAGRIGSGIFELAWGASVVVGLCDYAVRPKLVGRGEAMSPWMTLVALFGGIKLFGFAGLLLGPLIVGVALAMLRLYERARRFRLGLG